MACGTGADRESRPLVLGEDRSSRSRIRRLRDRAAGAIDDDGGSERAV